MTNLIGLIEDICDAEYEHKNYKGEKEKSSIISRFDSNADAKKAAIEKVVYEWANSQITEFAKDKRIAELEAKCYAYEQVIQKSNFAPMIIAGEEINTQFKEVFKEVEDGVWIKQVIRGESDNNDS